METAVTHFKNIRNMFVLFFLVATLNPTASEASSPSPTKTEITSNKTITVNYVQSPLEFAKIVPCDENKPRDLCLEGPFESGQFLTILISESNICPATTLETIWIESEIGSLELTKLKTDCVWQKNRNPIAVFSETVTDFKELAYPLTNDVKDATLISKISAGVRQRNLLGVCRT